MERTLFGKLLIAAALIIAVLLQYSLLFGEGGIRDVRELKKTIAEQKKENAKLADRNRILAAEVKDLKIGLEAVEEHGRLDLGMIKQNETFYLVTGNPDEQKSAEPPPPPAKVAH